MTAGNRRYLPPAAGFTLLEVMVALAILGLALSAILSAQAGLYSANVQARNLTFATAAGRCKMAELEEDLLKHGYNEIDRKEDGPCCNGESPKGVTCRWQIERVVLPDPPQNTVGDGGIGSGDAGAGPGGGGLGALGALAGAASDPASLGDGGIGALSQSLAGGVGPNGMPGVGGVAGMALGIVYPVLKPLLEASIRRITLEVLWNEGPNEKSIKLVQFVTNPQRGLPPVMGSVGDPGGVASPTGTPPPSTGVGNTAIPTAPR